MNKRPHNVNHNHNHNITLQTHKMRLNRQKAEDMCQTKLRKISKVKSKLIHTVPVINTLKQAGAELCQAQEKLGLAN